MHTEQTDFPAVATLFPASHAVQLDAPALLATVPASQMVHTEAPIPLKEPALQLEQDVELAQMRPA